MRAIPKSIFFLLISLQMIGSSISAPKNENTFTTVKIGVLAYRGIKKAKSRWQPTIEYLNTKIVTNKFELVALNLQQMTDYVAQNKLDFVITNTGNYVTLAHKYGVSRLATLINKTLDKKTMRFGAVIFTHKDNDKINSLQDLKGKTFIAVNKKGFGGFQMAWDELRKNNIDPFTDFSKLKFTGFPQSQVVEAVLKKEFIAGTFRTDSLERLAATGQIDLSKIKILNKKSNARFPFLYSTQLFPEWPFSKLKLTSESLGRDVVLALLSMDEDSDAAKAAKISGWTIPLNYKPANDMMKNLNVGPYTNLGKMSFNQVIIEYWKWLLTSIIVFLILSRLVFSVYFLNSKLKNTNDMLEEEVKKGQKLTKKLRYKATHDSLTKVFNRRAFKAFLEREILRCERHKKEFSILLIDIDKFKALNDKYGHQVGDEYLKMFAARVHHVLQKTDIFSRIGGDEFAVLCFDTDELSLRSIRKRILSTSHNIYNIEGNEIICNFSIGTATYPHDGTTIKELYVCADRDMYKNKEQHRT